MPEILEKRHFEDVDEELGYSYVGDDYCIISGNTKFSLRKYEDEDRVIISDPWEVKFSSPDTLELICFVRNVLFHKDIEIWHAEEGCYEPIPKV